MNNLPKGYDYRPLPHFLNLKESKIEGIGLFTLRDLPEGMNIGDTHVDNPYWDEEMFRLPMGGFINHSDKPNCKLVKYGKDFPNGLLVFYYLETTEDIKEGSELTLDYTKCPCGTKYITS